MSRSSLRRVRCLWCIPPLMSAKWLCLPFVVAVVDGVAFKLDVVGNGVSAQMVEGVVGAELFHVHSAVRHDVAHEVDVFQVAHDVEAALAPCLHIVQEAAAEALHELQACVVGLDVPGLCSCAWAIRIR